MKQIYDLQTNDSIAFTNYRIILKNECFIIVARICEHFIFLTHWKLNLEKMILKYQKTKQVIELLGL